MARTTIRGADLEQVIYEALANILESGEGVEVQLTLPDGVTLSDVAIRLDADVSRDGSTAAETDDVRQDDNVSDDESSDDESSDESLAPQEVSVTHESSNTTTRVATSDDTTDDENGDANHGDADNEAPVFDLADLEDEADAAADFIEGVLDAMDLPGDLRIKIDEAAGEAEVELLDVNTGALIGRRGQTLEALQELLRCSMQREFERRSRVKVDVEGYRARRLEKLIERAEEAIDDVLAEGEPVRLEPMDVFERKAIHRLVGEHDGVASRSQGREPGRRVVVEPA